MADSQISVQVTADTAGAKQGLAEVAAQTKELGATTVQASSHAYGSVLQLSGSVFSLGRGLSSLAKGGGGLGSILQIAGAGRAATGAFGALGGTAVAASAGVVAGFAAAAAAVVGVGLEVTKNTMGTEKWKETSNNAVESVVKMWGKAKTAVGEYWKQTAVGSFFDERAQRAKEAEVAAARELVEENERIAKLTGEALLDELHLAEAAGDAEKTAQLYARVRKEGADAAARDKAETLETGNILAKNSAWQKAADDAGAKMEREEKAIATAREIAKGQKLDPAKQRQLEKFADLADRSLGNVSERIKNLRGADDTRIPIKGREDAAARRQMQNELVNLARGGVGMETLATTLADKGMNSEEIVKTLESLQKRLPEGFADKLITHIKPGVIAWQ